MVDLVCGAFDVVELACDPHRWRTEIEEWVARHGGDKVLEYPTNVHSRMAPATERFFSAVRDRRLTHDGDPILTRHVLAAVTKPTQWGDTVQKDRRMSPWKIDAAVAGIIAVERAAWHRRQPKPVSFVPRRIR